MGRWAAKSVVQVFGDRCMLNQNGTVDWNFSVQPASGFFMAPDLILTQSKASLKFEQRNDDGGSWLGGSFPSPEPSHDTMTCQDYVDFFYAGVPGVSFEVGAGPVIQAFDGTWGAGSVIAIDENFVLIRLTKGTKDKGALVSEMKDWNSIEEEISVLELAPADSVREPVIVAVHNPLQGRTAGGWHITTSEIIVNCKETIYLDGYGGSATDKFAVDFIWRLKQLYQRFD